MSEKTIKFRFLVLILFFSFLFFNITYLPAFISSTGLGSEVQTGKADVGSSISLIMGAGLDCLEAENVSFRIGSDQTFLARKLSSERYASIFSIASLTSCVIFFGSFISNELFGQLSPLKIVLFMHSKDGMV